MSNYTYIKKVTIGNKNDFNFPLKEVNLTDLNKSERDILEAKMRKNKLPITYEENGEVLFEGKKITDLVEEQREECGDLKSRISTIPASAIIPKLVISDRLKKYLLSNRLVKKYDDKTSIVTFGNYLSEKLGLSYEEGEKISEYYNRRAKEYFLPNTDDSNPVFDGVRIHEFNKDYYIVKYYNNSCLMGKSIFRIMPINWYLKEDTNELIMDRKIIYDNYQINYLSEISKDSNVKFEDTLFYKNFFSTTFLDELLDKEKDFNLDCVKVDLNIKKQEEKQYPGITKIDICNESELDYNYGAIFERESESEKDKYIIYKKDNELYRARQDDRENTSSLDEICDELKVSKSNFDESIIFNSSYIVPKITIDDELKEYLLKNRVISKKENNIYEVTFGEHIGELVPYSRTIKKAYKHKNKLEERVTAPVVVEQDSQKQITYHMYYYPLYEYDNEKYVNISSTIYKIEPSKWYLNTDTNEMVYSKKIYGYYKPSRINQYISNVFLKDALKNERYFKELDNNKSPIEKRISEVISIIYDDENKQVFMDRILSVIEDYNEKINICKNNLGNKLTFGIEDQYTLESNLMFELSNIENSIKSYNLNAHKFKVMYDYMDSLNAILNKEKVESLDDFQSLIKDLVDISLTYINNPIYTNELRNILINNPTKVIEESKLNILNNKKDYQDFENLEEFILYLRTNLHPFLEKVDVIVDNKSLTEELHNEIINIRNYNFDVSHNKQISNYLLLLNETYVELNAVMDSEQREKNGELIADILDFNIDYNQDKTSIYNELTNRCHKIMKIYYDVLEENRVKESLQEIRLEKVKSSR